MTDKIPMTTPAPDTKGTGTPCDREMAMALAQEAIAYHRIGASTRPGAEGLDNLSRAFIEVSKENERLVAALRPVGPVPHWAARGFNDEWHYKQDMVPAWHTQEHMWCRAWCDAANRYESATGRKLP